MMPDILMQTRVSLIGMVTRALMPAIDVEIWLVCSDQLLFSKS